MRLSAGAEFIVMVCGDIMTMPGLPKIPAAERIDIDDNGNIIGLFNSHLTSIGIGSCQY